MATQGISTHWLRHTTLTWVERNAGYAIARAFAGHIDGGDTGSTATYVRASLHEVATALSVLTDEHTPWRATTQTDRWGPARFFWPGPTFDSLVSADHVRRLNPAAESLGPFQSKFAKTGAPDLRPAKQGRTPRGCVVRTFGGFRGGPRAGDRWGIARSDRHMKPARTGGGDSPAGHHCTG
ncbi:hypothetical protein [Streptoalloteichus hindustanus]|uniref:hypothetical protein n=1 Tax=Streptoalloteichus hindustanus TaxID=2017 RepID=UPI002E116117